MPTTLSTDNLGVSIVEVSPRDGLQNEKKLVSTADKVRLIEFLVSAGATRIEAVSFVHPRLVPQMADAEAVMDAVSCTSGVSYIGLVLNPRGAHRAAAAGVNEINYVLPATDAFAAANQNTTVAKALNGLVEVAGISADAGIRLSLTVAVAFGCPYQGDVPGAEVLDVVAEAVKRVRLDELALADTIGCATPWQVAALFGFLGTRYEIPLRAHFHETRHTALANTYAAMQSGVRIFDSSVGGLGGCPFAPGAAGNVATEDLAWMLERGGHHTGIDVNQALKLGQWISDVAGTVPRSGLSGGGAFPPAT